jgi:predicted nucleic-acid-binding protein
MIGLDTNILVRYIAQDDPIQSPIATDIMERRLTAQTPGFISLVAMVETVWVLERSYRVARAELAAIIERLLQTSTIVVEHERAVFAAMFAVRKGIGSFSDALIADLGERAGCQHTVTFDQKAAQLRGFVLA